MYVWGGVGRGKSVMINLFYDEADIKLKKRMHFHEFMAHTHKELERIRNLNEKIDDHVKYYAQGVAKECHLLVLDELQINNIADAMIVGRLFSWLIHFDVYIFFSSNRMPHDLFNDGLQRDGFLAFLQLIDEKMDVFNLDNATDYRSESAHIGDSYLQPVTKHNLALVETFIHQISGEKPLYEQKLLVDKNRYITAYQTYGQMAVFTFKELCEVNLGAIDYIAICKNFNKIIIKFIPKLKPENHNELLRFITLIDCLYEAGTKLICLAECEIDDIYSNGKHAFEFQRTISRLKQMHSGEHQGGLMRSSESQPSHHAAMA
jgi:cell division protein ZapE